MRRIFAALTAALIAACAGTGLAQAPEPPDARPLTQILPGNTVAGVLFMPHDAPRGGGSLSRVVFQAFLRPDGSALARRWDGAHDSYTAPAEGRWRIAADTLCLDVPGLADGPEICVEAHVWGPRIAGNTSGAGRFALLDGSIEPGNSLAAP